MAIAEARRQLGFFSCVCIVAGAMVGMGIFIHPPGIAKLVNSDEAFLAIWALAGLTAFAGATAYAELGAMMPRAGGDYVFIREAFGPSMGFACGWVTFLGGGCGSIATLSVALAQFQIPVLTGIDTSIVFFNWPWGGEFNLSMLIGLLVVVSLSELNVRGLRFSARLQVIMTLVPIGLLTLIALYALGPTAPPSPLLEAGPSAWSWAGLAQAFLAAYFAFAGWGAVVYVAGDVKDPGKTIPRALIIGCIGVSTLYLLLCLAFLNAFGLQGLSQQIEAGSGLASLLGGREAELFMVALIAAGVLTSLNATVLGGGHIAFALAEGGVFWRKATHISSRTSTPDVALRAQAAITSLIIISGTFEQILSMTTVAMVLIASLAVASLFKLRRRAPNTPRPYRALGYPVLPFAFLLASGLVIGVLVVEAVSNGGAAAYGLIGLPILAIAFGYHRLMLRDN